MKTVKRGTSALAGAVSATIAAVVTLGCETEDATTAVVDNAYEAADSGSTAVTVYEVWYATTLFPPAEGPGAASTPQRVAPGSATAYALLAVGWDASSASPPTKLVPVRSIAPLSVTRGDELHITVSDATFAGRCGFSQALSQDDADFITQRIFPGSFADLTYDAKTCSTSRTGDAGTAAAP